jgi:hypothetical protein
MKFLIYATYCLGATPMSKAPIQGWISIFFYLLCPLFLTPETQGRSFSSCIHRAFFSDRQRRLTRKGLAWCSGLLIHAVRKFVNNIIHSNL